MTTYYPPNSPLETLLRNAWLTIHDEVAVPDAVAEWAEGSFRTGFIAALAMVGEDRRSRRGRVTRAAIEEALATVDRNAALLEPGGG